MPTIQEDIETIIATVPGFHPSWERFLKQYAGEKSPMWYTGMSELAHYVVESYARGTTTEFSNLSAAIERLLQIPDSDVEILITIGLFEDIQSIASHRDFGFGVFRSWLGPQSLIAWDEVDAGMQRVAAWEWQNRRRWWQFWRRKPFDARKALQQLESPELRKIVESTFRKDS
jgi:hypothetical protein